MHKYIGLHLYTAAVQFKNGAKSIINSKYLEMVNFHSHMYAD